MVLCRYIQISVKTLANRSKENINHSLLTSCPYNKPLVLINYVKAQWNVKKKARLNCQTNHHNPRRLQFFHRDACTMCPIKNLRIIPGKLRTHRRSVVAEFAYGTGREGKTMMTHRRSSNKLHMPPDTWGRMDAVVNLSSSAARRLHSGQPANHVPVYYIHTLH